MIKGSLQLSKKSETHKNSACMYVVSGWKLEAGKIRHRDTLGLLSLVEPYIDSIRIPILYGPRDYGYRYLIVDWRMCYCHAAHS